jgi:hypothetical protein
LPHKAFGQYALGPDEGCNLSSFPKDLFTDLSKAVWVSRQVEVYGAVGKAFRYFSIKFSSPLAMLVLSASARRGFSFRLFSDSGC